MEEYRIDNTFEIPSDEEWNQYLGIDLFSKLRINVDNLKISNDFLTGMIFDLRC